MGLAVATENMIPVTDGKVKFTLSLSYHWLLQQTTRQSQNFRSFTLKYFVYLVHQHYQTHFVFPCISSESTTGIKGAHQTVRHLTCWHSNQIDLSALSKFTTNTHKIVGKYCAKYQMFQHYACESWGLNVLECGENGLFLLNCVKGFYRDCIWQRRNYFVSAKIGVF